MYTKRIQLVNYGPIAKLSLEFPFEGETPKPIVLVGENGSGKSILLSNIVNGLIEAKGAAYRQSPEVDLGMVYKLRSSSYVKTGCEFYYVKVDFEGSQFVEEMRLTKPKKEHQAMPIELSDLASQGLWDETRPEAYDKYRSSFSSDHAAAIEDVFASNCVLYFPPDRFEEPAWLNEDNLKSQAQHMDLKHIQGYTARKVIDYSPLHDNQNWLFDLIYDRAAFEFQTRQVSLPLNNADAAIPLPVFTGYSGHAARIYETALQMVRVMTKRQDARFGIGRRNNRVVSLTSDLTGPIVPNIFQLSSGETSILNIFLSILRDFDLCGAAFSGTSDIRGIVVVDEIDLHLHTSHQHEILPELIKMFPRIQFVMTTHSPLFVLGMQKEFGEDGFALYRLPQGQQINPEEFSEFGAAYQSFAATRTFASDIQKAIEENQNPVLLPEGETDKGYLERASQVLERQEVLQSFQVKDGGGAGTLTNIYRDFHAPLTDLLQSQVVLLFDCDKKKPNVQKGQVYQRTIPFHGGNPVKEGIENLFSRETLQRAKEHNPAHIDIESEHESQVNGQQQTVPEKWTVNTNKKSELCKWLCEHGTKGDFQAFNEVFDLLNEILTSASENNSEKTPAISVDLSKENQVQ